MKKENMVMPSALLSVNYHLFSPHILCLFKSPNAEIINSAFFSLSTKNLYKVSSLSKTVFLIFFPDRKKQ